MKYSDILNIMEREISCVVEELRRGIDIDEPLKSKVFELLNAPSKHIRPLVSFLYLKACGYEIDEKQILFQAAIELVHNASLIHDDIIDESSVRRGISTINKDLGNQIGVISGDYLLSCAFEKLLKLNSFELVEMFANTLRLMSEGEIQQQVCLFKVPTIDEYLDKTYKKTAKLFETAIVGSMKLAGMDDCCDFAKNFGMAFQIKDDLVNAKTSKSDIEEGIYTAPIIFCPDNIEIGIEKTCDLLNNYLKKADDAIKNLPDNIYKKALKELTKNE